MSELLFWPANPPTALEHLGPEVASRIGASGFRTIGSLDAIGPLVEEAAETVPVLIILDSNLSGPTNVAEMMRALQAIAEVGNLNLVFVGGDGYLGTDQEDLASASVVAAAVAMVRSLATRRGGSTRANLVCVPAGLYGVGGSQRGPIGRPVECRDVAAAAAFLLGDAGAYVSGQVLYVNGGRQLFSSATA